MQRVHLDTWALMVALVGGEFEDRVKQLLRQSGTHSYSFVTCQVALGEAVAVILRDGPDSVRLLHGLLGLLADIRVDPGRCMPPIDRATFAVANELLSVVPELDMADRVILAHALADPDSLFFITNDRKMVNNPLIIRYEKSLRTQGRRNTKLTITPPEASLVF